MASLDEFNPGRWEAEDEDFLDREDNYVLQKSTNTMVTNVTAKSRRRTSRDQRITNPSSKTMNSSKREPPSFASARSIRKTRKSSSNKRSSASSSSLQKKGHSSSSKPASNQPKPTPTATSARKPPPEPSLGAPPANKKQSFNRSKQTSPVPPTTTKEPDSDEESLDIAQVFPVLSEPKPKVTNERLYQSQQIYIPTKQEKWNEASVMRMHQSMFSVHRGPKESPYMKDMEFDDDDKSLSIEDVFPVLANKATPKQAAKTPSSSGPAILQAAKRAHANQRWTTAGQKIAATVSTTKTLAATPPPPSAPPPSPKAGVTAAAAPPVSTSTAGKPPSVPLTRPSTTTTTAPTTTAPTTTAPTTTTAPNKPNKVASLVNQFEQKGHDELQETTASSVEGAKKGYQLPTHVSKPTPSVSDELQASDDLTMDSALLRGSSGNNDGNLKEQEEREAAAHKAAVAAQEAVKQAEERQRQFQQQMQQRRQQEQEEEEEQRRREAAKLERRRPKRSKKSSKSKKKKKSSSKSSRRRSEHYASESSMTQKRDRDASLGPESLMEHEEAERARRHRLKKEKKERKRERKRQKAAAREAQSEGVQMTKSMPEIEESRSSSAEYATSRNMSKSQPLSSSKPALDSYLKDRERPSDARGSTRRSLPSAANSRQSGDSKRTSKSDGHIMRAQPLRKRRDGDDDDPGLDSYIRDGKKKSTETSSKMPLRSDSHTTVQTSNVAQKKDPSSFRPSPSPPLSPKEERPPLDPDSFMKSAAAGMLYESEDSMSPGAAAAARNRVRTARAESRRMASPSTSDDGLDYGPLYGKNSSIKPVLPAKEPFEKNVSSTWQQSSSLPSSREDTALKSSSSIFRPTSQKKPAVPNKSTVRTPQSPGHRGDSPVRRPDLMNNDRMNSIGNFDMVSAVDAAVALKKAEKQGAGKASAVDDKKKKKGLIKRVFSRSGKKKRSKSPERRRRSMPVIMEGVKAEEQSSDQAALNEYLSSSSSQPSWYESSAHEKEELSNNGPTNTVELPSDGGFKYALGTPPGEKSRLSSSLPHDSRRRRGHRRSSSA